MSESVIDVFLHDRVDSEDSELFRRPHRSYVHKSSVISIHLSDFPFS